MPFRNQLLLVVTIAAVAAGCGAAADGGGTTVQTVSSIQITPQDPVIAVGGSTTLSATVLDAQSKAISGKVVTWSSSNPASATIDASTGVVRGVSSGSGVLTAAVDGKTATVTFLVAAPALTSVIVNPVTQALVAGQQLALSTTLKDNTGAIATGRVITWSSSATRVATVSSAGVVSLLSAGTVTITATSESLTGSIVLVVTAPAGSLAPTIASVSPASLAPGAVVTVAGTNFSTTLTGNVVYVDGVPATVTAATGTQITATLASTYGCTSTHNASVDVVTPGGSATTTKSFVTGTTRALGVGQSFLAADAASRSCNEVPASGSYVISVFNANRSPASVTSVELRGTTGGNVASSASIVMANARPNVVAAPATTGASLVAQRNPRLVAAAREHAVIQEFNHRMLKQAGTARRYRMVPRVPAASMTAGMIAANTVAANGGTTAPAALEVVPLTVGATTHINFTRTSCALSGAPAITARVVYVGPKAIALEDNSSALAGKVDQDMIDMAKQWEEVSYPAIAAKIADPLAYDRSLDNNGRIIMMFTPMVNNASANLLGFVSTCNFFPASTPGYSGSNQAEIFFARVITDTVSTSASSINTRVGWKRQMPSTIAHESKHIASAAERMATPIEVTSIFDDIWMEEGTAQIAAELYARGVEGNTWKDNSTYSVLACEFMVTTPGCRGGDLAMYNNFDWLETYLRDVENSSLITTSSADGSSLYGASWLFNRWLIDTYAGGNEGAFGQAISKNFLNYGIDNVTQVTGKSWAELFSQFTLMLAADDVAGATSPFIEPSWNMPAVWTGYHTANSAFSAAPLNARSAAFGSFTAQSAGLKGGTAMIIRLNGTPTGGTQLLDLRALGGAALGASTGIGISVLRVQ